QLALNVISIPIFAKKGETSMDTADEQVRRAFGLRRDEFRRAKIARMQQEGSGDASADTGTYREPLEALIGELSAALRAVKLGDDDVNALADLLEQASEKLDRLLAQARADNGGEDDEVTMVA